MCYAKRNLLQHPVSEKPDMSRDEWASEAAFLKERWNLVQKGEERNCVKLRGNHIYVNNNLNGSLVIMIISQLPVCPHRELVVIIAIQGHKILRVITVI